MPDSFFACDGLLESTLHVLDDFDAFPGRIEAELRAELPFLTTTRVLTAAVRAGMGREDAHRVIHAHATRAAEARRSGGHHDLWKALGSDPELPLTAAEVRAVARSGGLSGRAGAQVDAVTAEIAMVVGQHPEAAAYRPGPLL